MSNNGTMEPEWNIDRNKWPAHGTEMEQKVGSVDVWTMGTMGTMWTMWTVWKSVENVKYVKGVRNVKSVKLCGIAPVCVFRCFRALVKHDGA